LHEGIHCATEPVSLFGVIEAECWLPRPPRWFWSLDSSFATRLDRAARFNRNGSSHLPRLDTVHLNPGVLAFVLVISIASGLTFGLAPAWQSTRLNTTAERVTNRARGLFVAAEYAIAVALLAAAGLLPRSFQRVESAELGFEPHHIVTMPLDLHANASYEQAIERIQALPGVERGQSAMPWPTTSRTTASPSKAAQCQTVPNRTFATW
jgi:hypothetical protein